MKKFFLLFLVFSYCSLFNLFAQTPSHPDSSQTAWRILEKAEVAFDNGKFDEALRMANLAKINKQKEIDWKIYILNRAVTPNEVKREGEEFVNVLKILQERDEHIAIKIIKTYLECYSVDFFKNSISYMVSWIEKSSVYPEADFLLGKIYRLEGEYELASDFYESARKNIAFLDVPQERFDILYSMADLAYDRNQIEEYEQILLLLLSETDTFKDANLEKALMRTIDSDKNADFDRFFVLYRRELSLYLKAYHYLLFLNYERQDYNVALKCAAIATVGTFTHILSSIQSRDHNFNFTTFGNFLAKIDEYEDVKKWIQDNNVWDIYFTFIELCGRRGSKNFAFKGFSYLKENCPDEYWKKRASIALEDF